MELAFRVRSQPLPPRDEPLAERLGRGVPLSAFPTLAVLPRLIGGVRGRGALVAKDMGVPADHFLLGGSQQVDQAALLFSLRDQGKEQHRVQNVSKLFLNVSAAPAADRLKYLPRFFNEVRQK